MIYRLEIENFYSIRDRQILDLSIDSNVVDDENRYSPIFLGSEKRAPKVVSIFGANASGKTTVLRALEFIVYMITKSVDQTNGFWAAPFNDEKSANSPMRFAVELGGPIWQSGSQTAENLDHGTFRYELEIFVEDGIPKRILREALRKRYFGRGKWQRVFDRSAEGQVNGSSSFRLTGYGHLVKTLAPNHSVLASFARFTHPESERIVRSASQALFVIDSLHLADKSVVQLLKQNPAHLQSLNNEIGRVDFGVKQVRVQESDDGPYLMFKHYGLRHEMGWNFESKGTRSFIKAYPLINFALETGTLVAVDEIDDSIHPNLLPEIKQWFYNALRNPLSAQLWFTSHAVSLLEHLKKEEIVICEKDEEGRTKLFSLMDVKALRRDDNHYRKYVDGIYGGVPSIG